MIRIMKKNKIRSVITCLLVLGMLLSLTACGGARADYQGYVKSLITANYIGVTDGYIKYTGANEEDVDALYLQNVARLASNLSDYYSLDIWNDTELSRTMTSLARKIYGCAKFDVSKAYKDNNIDYVNVIIYPIDIINQTNEQIVDYINGFNADVAAGRFDDYTKDEYEYEYASGIMGILAEAVNNITYADPVTVKVRIILSDETYYIGNEDFRAIDSYIIAAEVSDPASETDASEAVDVPEKIDAPEAQDVIDATLTDSEQD